MGAAAVSPPPSPVSREEEEAKAAIWRPYPPTQDEMERMPDGTELETCLNMATDEITYRVLGHQGLDGDEPFIVDGERTIGLKQAQREGLLTPQTDPTANAPKKRGWPKGKKRGPRKVKP